MTDLGFAIRQLMKKPGFTIVAGLLPVRALLGCWLPARRAANVDPMEALRAE